MFDYLHFVRRNARFLGFGFLLTFFSSFGQTTFIGLFGADLRAEFGLSHSTFGLLYAVATLASGFSLIWLGRWADRLDLRLYVALVCLAMASSALGFASASGVAGLGLALFALRLSCQGLLVHTAVTAMARYFLEGRGKAVSLASTGNTVGQGLFPPLAVAAAAAWGWRPTWIAIALGGVLVLIPLALWLLLGQRERHERLTAALEAASPKPGAVSPVVWTRSAVLRDPAFYLVAPALLAAPFITTGFFFHIGALAEAKAWELGWLSGLYPAYAAVTVAAALAAGGLIDRRSAVRLLPRFLWPLAGGLALLALFDHWLAAAGYMALMGMTAGANYTLNGAIWAELYGVSHIGAIRALATALMIFATAASPAIFGGLLDAGVPIEAIAAGCIGWALLAGPVAARIRR